MKDELIEETVAWLPLDKAESYLAWFKPHFEAALEGYLNAKSREASQISPEATVLIEEIRRLVASGGKRVRPAFLYSGYVAAGGLSHDAAIFASRITQALSGCKMNSDCAKAARLALTEGQKQAIDRITQQRNALAEKLGLKAHLLIGTDDIREAVVATSLDHVRAWQRELLRKEKVVEF